MNPRDILARHHRHAGAIRLFWWLERRLDPVEYRALKISEMARGTAMQKAQVIRSLRTLRALNVVHRNGRAWARGPYTYRLIPNPIVPENAPQSPA